MSEKSRSKIIERNGSCLGGASRFTAKSISKNVIACNCGMCRKWGSEPLMAVECGTDVSLTGEETISIFELSAWAERDFCNQY